MLLAWQRVIRSLWTNRKCLSHALMFQVDECKQQMLARIADQKADCEMVSDTSTSKLPEVLFLPCRGTCLGIFPIIMRLLTMRSYIDVMIAHLAVWQQGRETELSCGQSAFSHMPCRSSICSHEAYFVLAPVHAYMSKPLTDMSQANAAVLFPVQSS